MQPILITLLMTAPIIAIGTAVYLWWQRASHSVSIRSRVWKTTFWVVLLIGPASFALWFLLEKQRVYDLAVIGILWVLSVVSLLVERRKFIEDTK